MKTKRKMIRIDEDLCDGCGLCVPSCAEGAIRIVEGKARLAADVLCDGLGACLGECPRGALSILEREADPYDHEAVARHLSQKALLGRSEDLPPPGGCPSRLLQVFPQMAAASSQGMDSATSALGHWPVQIHLVPPTAPFLQGADLLVAADCTPVAYPRFHQDFLEGRVILMGCPKFDDSQAYLDKFVAIFTQNEIRSVTALVMEVPCCQGLPLLIRRAMELAGRRIPLKKVVVSTKGTILREETIPTEDSRGLR